ncbi:hypothetical protein VNO78_33002 [Psophocarpus tetragonolobus]|uniref:Uncharacterized protein n=1 Tax=Psophocarpus tetragonolobus TaxID=3891 RepID=A0AAN9NW61_PSOTE
MGLRIELRREEQEMELGFESCDEVRVRKVQQLPSSHPRHHAEAQYNFTFTDSPLELLIITNLVIPDIFFGIAKGLYTWLDQELVMVLSLVVVVLLVALDLRLRAQDFGALHGYGALKKMKLLIQYSLVKATS